MQIYFILYTYIVLYPETNETYIYDRISDYCLLQDIAIKYTEYTILQIYT